MKSLPALKNLTDAVKAKETSPNEGGYLRSIDGRRLKFRQAHSALNTLLQNCAAVIAKIWYITICEDLAEAGIVYAMHGFFHDEIQLSIIDDDDTIEKASKIVLDAAMKAGNILKMKLPVEAECKTGKTWYDTH